MQHKKDTTPILEWKTPKGKNTIKEILLFWTPIQKLTYNTNYNGLAPTSPLSK